MLMLLHLITNNVDLINGIFNFLGGFLCWVNVYSLYRDKQIKGIHWLPTVTFGFWGIWNLIFYSHLMLWYSFFGDLNLTLANVVWLWLLVQYNWVGDKL